MPLFLLLALASAYTQPAPAPAEASRAAADDSIGSELARLRETARTAGEPIWPGYGRAPFGLLLVGRDQEVLLCQPGPPAGFTPAGRDEAIGCDRFVRPRTGLPEGLLAAMPIFGPPSTIVMGTREATALTLARWRSTLLHEHFHQWQTALPGYFDRVAALDLAGGDQSGMWMLNFPFPYADPAVGAAYANAAQMLADAIAARGTGAFAGKVAAYVERRRALAAVAGTRNWRYLDFQLWQEGVARWTEIALGRASGDEASRADAAAREREVMAGLREPDLAGQGRLVAYALGAGEAMLLEACGPQWRTRYPGLLALGPLLEEAAARCQAT